MTVGELKERLDRDFMEREYYIMEVAGEGCYCLCYDDETGKRIVLDWDLEMRED